MLKRIALLIGILLLSSTSNAAVIAWDAPTNWTDGTALTVSEQLLLTYVPATSESASGP